MFEDVRNPLGILLVCFLPPDGFDVLGVSKDDGAGGLQDVVNENPILPSGLHTHILAVVFSKPSSAPPKIPGEGEEPLALVGGNALLVGGGDTGYLDAVIQDGRVEHESRALVEPVDRAELTEPVILIADCGYEAYNNIAHIERKYLIRVKDKQGILSGLGLPDAQEFDAVFSYSLSKRLTNRIRREPQKYRWTPSEVHFDYIRDASDALYPISLRVVRFAVKESMYETVIANLPADQSLPLLLRELYHKRWGIETSFRDLKYTLAQTHFHAKKRPFIKQEIFSRMTFYNFASLLRLHTIFTQPEGTHVYHINAAFAVSSFLMYVFTKPPRDSLPEAVSLGWPS